MGHGDILRFDEIASIVRAAASLGIKRIRLTGGEPLVRRDVCDLVSEIASIEGIDDVSLTTNGILLPRMARDLKRAGLKRVNVSLDALDPRTFAEITRIGRLEDTLAGIDAALEAGFNPVKVNAVTVRRLNQDFLAFARMSVDRPLHVRFIEYMPIGGGEENPGCGWDEGDVITSDEVLGIINDRAAAEGLAPLVPADNSRPIGGGPARYYRFEGAQGTVGFISPRSRHFCASCNRLRCTADGKIMPCLFSDERIDIKTAAASGDEEAIRSVLVRAMGGKPDEHHDRVGTERGMSQIGG
ncbi:MAG: GTP 3',8-cyclase MoaA, partial [Myxococcaceae bacterium]|nr:GTP 3',8-cyclase MoaA [Myxococcaceae bacterium]